MESVESFTVLDLSSIEEVKLSYITYLQGKGRSTSHQSRILHSHFCEMNDRQKELHKVRRSKSY